MSFGCRTLRVTEDINIPKDVVGAKDYAIPVQDFIQLMNNNVIIMGLHHHDLDNIRTVKVTNATLRDDVDVTNAQHNPYFNSKFFNELGGIGEDAPPVHVFLTGENMPIFRLAIMYVHCAYVLGRSLFIYVEPRHVMAGPFIRLRAAYRRYLLSNKTRRPRINCEDIMDDLYCIAGAILFTETADQAADHAAEVKRRELLLEQKLYSS
jgi:hypothetical protein